jgi:hypothetical protein
MRLRSVVLLLLMTSHLTFAMKIDRVILSGDKPFYLDFWPYAARAWKQLLGIKPTLVIIGDHKVDTSLGDVIRFKPIKGVPTGLTAQVIRLLLPALFPNDVCIISDIDQLPIKASYFRDMIASIPVNKFVIYNDKAYKKDTKRLPMCYCVAQGKTFAELFNLKSPQDISRKIKKWNSYNHGFFTDEQILYNYIKHWKDSRKRCVKLGDGLGPRDKRRINRNRWKYDPALVKKGFYVDAHLLRPYKTHKKELDNLARLAGVKNIP